MQDSEISTVCATIQPSCPVEGDLYVDAENYLLVYKSGWWQRILTDHRFPDGYIQVGDSRISTQDVDDLVSLRERLPEIVLLIDFLKQSNVDSELTQQFNIYKAEKILAGKTNGRL